MSDDYIMVEARLRALTPKAALLSPNNEPRAVWVPRSLMHGADERELSNQALDTDFAIRVREWFAEREGLV